MEKIELKVQERRIFGKRNRFLRRNGYVPAHIYGPGSDSKALQVDMASLARLMNKTGRNTMLSLKEEGNGKGEDVFLWNVQRHPVTGNILHVDFFKPDITKPIRSRVPVRTVGEAPARRDGAVIVVSLPMLEIEALPSDIPEGITADLSTLEHINQNILVRDLKLPAKIKVISPADQAVVRAAPPRKEEEVAKPEVAAAAPTAEGAPAAEAGKAAAPAAEGAKAATPAPAAAAKPAAEKK